LSTKEAVFDVAVVGGGAAGLAAAYELHQRGASFVLLEAAPRLGGVIRTEQVDGFTLDAGPDSLLVQKPAALELCRELGLGERLVPTLEPRTGYILRNRLLPIPGASVLGIPTAIAPWVGTALLSPAAKLRMAAEWLIPRGDATQESVGDFFRRRFGREMVEYVAEPMLAGIHAGDVDRLSIQSLFPRLVEAERTHGSVIRALRSARAKTDRPSAGPFRSLPGGIEELVTALVATLPSAAIRRGSRALDLSGPSPFAVRVGEGPAVSARAVILATPAHATADLVRGLDDRLAALCAQIAYTSTATVLLSYPQSSVRRPLPGTGFLVPRTQRGVPLTAGSVVSSKWPGRAPEGQVLLRGFLGGARDPEVLSRPDDELIDRTHKAFAGLLNIACRPDLTRVYRWERVMAQHNVGHIDRVAAIEDRLGRVPGLFVTGAGFRGVGIPDCVADARATARAVVEWQRERRTPTTP
jgi:oxygen-dependent protoporphyrinogen oxidase